MVRVGLVDFDTSHVIQFTKRMNHVEIEEDQWVDGAKIVAGCPCESKHSPDRIPGYTAELKDMGVEIVKQPEDLLGKIDAVCIEANDGSVHLERAKPFLEAGLPCYIDKPFEVSLERAKEIMKLAKQHKVPTFSASSLRFCPEVQETLGEEGLGKILGVQAYSPASEHPVNPGLFNYGIHGVEILYTLMGGGCARLSCAYTEGAEVVTGVWKDGRLGTMRGTREGAHSYGFVAWGEKGVKQSGISTQYIYRELLEAMIRMFETGVPPISPEVTLEIVAFIVAALKSREENGSWVDLDL